jgi:hypothetical protein
MVRAAVSVGATISTGTFTGIPPRGTTIVVLLRETERSIGGGEKASLAPQPVKTRTNTEEAMPILDRMDGADGGPALLDLTILQHLLCHFSWRTRPLL